jgi:hypothetical protein
MAAMYGNGRWATLFILYQINFENEKYCLQDIAPVVRWKSTDVSEEHIGSIFRAEE